MQTHRTKAQEQPQARHLVIDVATQPNYFNFKIAVTRVAFWFSTSSNMPSINAVFLLLNGFRFNLSRWSRFPASQNERSSQDKECDPPGFPRNTSRLTLCKPPLQMLWPLQPLRGLRVPACYHRCTRPATVGLGPSPPSGSAQGPAAQRTHLQVTCLVLMAAGTRAGVALNSQGLHRRGPARPSPAPPARAVASL